MALMELLVEVFQKLNCLQKSVRSRIVAHEHIGQLEKFGITKTHSLILVSFDHSRIITEATQALMEEDKTEDMVTKSAFYEHISIPEEFKYLI